MANGPRRRGRSVMLPTGLAAPARADEGCEAVAEARRCERRLVRLTCFLEVAPPHCALALPQVVPLRVETLPDEGELPLPGFEPRFEAAELALPLLVRIGLRRLRVAAAGRS